MNKTEKEKEILSRENDELRKTVGTLQKKILELEEHPAISHEDTLRLAIIDRAPFTMWACNRNFEIVLWTPQCEANYQRKKREAIGADFVELFVSEPEKKDAREDCIDIIDNNENFINFIAEDFAKNGSPRYMLTNCFRVWDKENGEWLQAETALEISDIEEALKEHRSLREAGIALVAKSKRYLEIEQKDLSSRAGIAYAGRLDILRRQKDQLSQYIARLNREGNQEVADGLKQSSAKENQGERKRLKGRMEELISAISNADTLDMCELLAGEVEKFEKEGI